eukprot:TRINITY_DN1875_c0_g1_i1.p1 TRINITY_DN1875_c0_g1~~TRINITY_DN1875_c0_g1_i1.p1  ORF type:complete len:277 (+),score=27.70 TRINITY_DN1875_c0_g1_i1:42-872(+)
MGSARLWLALALVECAAATAAKCATIDFLKNGTCVTECVGVVGWVPPPPTPEPQAGEEPKDEAGAGGNDQTGAGGNDQTGAGGNDEAGAGGNDQTGAGGNDEAGAGGNDQTGAGGNDEAGAGGNDTLRFSGSFYDGETLNATNVTESELCAVGYAINRGVAIVCSVDGGVATLDGQVCDSIATKAAVVPDDDGTDVGLIVVIVLVIVLIFAALTCMGYQKRQQDAKASSATRLSSPLFDKAKDFDRAADGKADAYFSQRARPPPTFSTHNYADDVL